MSSSYSFETPSSITINQGIVRFFEDFYRISDTPDAHDVYTDQFTAGATFTLASKVSNGADEIRKTREGMWAHVESRKHTVHKIFPFGPNSNEVMLYGTVAYDLKAGGQSEIDWAGHAVVQLETDGKWRLSFYQVYMDTGKATSTK